MTSNASPLTSGVSPLECLVSLERDTSESSRGPIGGNNGDDVMGKQHFVFPSMPPTGIGPPVKSHGWLSSEKAKD